MWTYSISGKKVHFISFPFGPKHYVYCEEEYNWNREDEREVVRMSTLVVRNVVGRDQEQYFGSEGVVRALQY